MRDLLGPYGVPDPTDIDPFDYERDGLPFDAPEGYAQGDYWLREQLLAAGEREATRSAWARTPRHDELADVIACLRKVLTDGEGTASADPKGFSRERVWDAARRLGYTFDEGRVLEKGLVQGGHLVAVRFERDSDDSPRPIYAMPSADASAMRNRGLG